MLSRKPRKESCLQLSQKMYCLGDAMTTFCVYLPNALWTRPCTTVKNFNSRHFMMDTKGVRKKRGGYQRWVNLYVEGRKPCQSLDLNEAIPDLRRIPIVKGEVCSWGSMLSGGKWGSGELRMRSNHQPAKQESIPTVQPYDQ